MANVCSFETVVVGVDFSKYSTLVVKQALDLARRSQAKLVLVHVFERLPYLDEKFFSDVKKDFIHHFELQIKSKYGKLIGNRNVATEVHFGKTADELVHIAGNYRRPLLMVGHRSHGALSRVFVGSTAERLAVISPFPVWIHRGQKIIVPKRFLVPIDLTVAAEEAQKFLTEFCVDRPIKKELLYVFSPLAPVLDHSAWLQAEAQWNKTVETALKQMKAKHPRDKVTVLDGDPSTKISSHGKKFDAIVMAPHHRKKFFPTLGSVTAKVVRAGHTPVIVVPMANMQHNPKS